MPRSYEVARISIKSESKLHSALPKGARVIALDEHGRDLTTVQFAKLLQKQTVFVIGGPDGLGEKTKAAAQMQLRLSSLTLPHALAQVVLLEQLYRAASLLAGHPYHRA